VFNTVGGFAERYLRERSLRSNTVAGYRQLLESRILPRFRDTPLVDVTLGEIKAWRGSLDPTTEATNAAAYRLLRSLLQAAEEEELIDRAPPKIRGASTARVKRIAKPATFDELAIIIDNMPQRLRLFVVLAAFVGLREGEALELRRSDVDGRTGRIDITRKVDKNSRRGVPGACRECGRPITALRPPAACAPSTCLPRSSNCCSGTCSSTPPRARPACSSPATAPTT
jgi:integrase